MYNQNENVQRASTSERFVPDLRRPDRRTAMKVLVKKTFHFVNDVWREYIRWKISDLRYMYMYMWPYTIILLCTI